MLTLEIEYLTGAVRAASDAGDAADWPPQPDRLFSALVASWGAGDADDAGRGALEWLERQPPPRVLSRGRAEPRTLVSVFVPPNDPKLVLKVTKKGSSSAAFILPKNPGPELAVLPGLRSRQERRFPACVPEDPVVRMVWEHDPPSHVLDALIVLARDTSYLGHSSSLVRCEARMAREAETGGEAARQVPYPGRLAELERAFRVGVRPAPGVRPTLVPSATPVRDRPRGVFGREWIVFRHLGGARPDAVEAAVAAKTLLKTVQAGYGSDGVPAWISGHAADGTLLAAPHLACVPLLDVGWTWSTGGLMGLALVLPRSLEEASRRATDPAVTALPEDALARGEEDALLGALLRQGAGTRELELGLPSGAVWRVAHAAHPRPSSLRTTRYGAYARSWATATPIALDRHPRAEGDVEASISAACLRTGLPRPLRVAPSDHSAFRGAASAGPSRGAARRWRLPRSLIGRPLVHAALEFEEAVEGPMMLGAGRFCGLGLCLPLAPESTA